MNNCGVIILAAGEGRRFGSKKQFAMLEGKEIWKWPYETLAQLCDQIIVVGVDIAGGKTRQESVQLGLEKIDREYVIVHDSARPLVNISQLKKMQAALEKGSDSVSFYLPITDAIISENAYLDRNGLKAIVTPQGFNTSILRKAHLLAKETNAIDDCSLVQKYLHLDPFLIKGDKKLYKITESGDMIIIKSLKNQY